ncbi:MAG: hypothetical protein KTR35_08355 [Gammaproteobacteria bacterium]|nr:hypothetical protein [Gammaproteobacteria bacterium]
MPDWNDYKSAAIQRGSLALELYVAVSTPIKPAQELQQALPDHLAFQTEQEKAGTLAFAGPLSDLTGELMEGVGMIVYRAESLEAARAIADADPMHSRGIRDYTLRRWMINEGSLQLDIKLSEQSIAL